MPSIITSQRNPSPLGPFVPSCKKLLLSLEVKVIIWALSYFRTRLECRKMVHSRVMDWFLSKRCVRNLGCYGLEKIDRILQNFFVFFPEKKGFLTQQLYWRPHVYLLRKEMDLAKRLCRSSFSFTTSPSVKRSIAQKVVLHGLRQGEMVLRELYDRIRKY